MHTLLARPLVRGSVFSLAPMVFDVASVVARARQQPVVVGTLAGNAASLNALGDNAVALLAASRQRHPDGEIQKL